MKKTFAILLALILTISVLINVTAEEKKLSIVATTGYLGDAVLNIAPNADIKVLVKSGGDPHTQELTTGDIKSMETADAVIWTSHFMEVHMMDQLEALGEKQLAAAEFIPEDMLLPWIEDGKIEGKDPHVWNSPDAWKYVVNAIADHLAKIDSANGEMYKKNAKEYCDKITTLSNDAKKKIDLIPEENRVLVTGHDAFNYLGKTYGIEIHATDFVSSEAEMSAVELEELVNLIVDKKIPVIFQDNLKNPEAIEKLQLAVKAKGGKVEVSDKPLYADSLGEEAPLNTYIGAFSYNVDAIVEALSSK